MFLFERLVGIGIYTLALLVVCFLIAYSNGSCKRLLKFYLFVLCVMAFFYDPYVTADLYRLHQTMEWYATMEFGFFFKELVITTSVPLSRILFWIIGEIGVLELVSVISTYICYSLLFYVIRRTQEIYKISRKNVAATLILLMSTSIFISVAGGIRMMVGMSLIAYCFFRESVEQRFNFWHLVWYVCAVLMHNLSLVIIGLRMLVLVSSKRTSARTRLIYILLFFVAMVVALMRFSHLAADVLESVQGYLYGESFSDKWEYIIGVMLILGLFSLTYKYRRLGCQRKYPELYEMNLCMHVSTIIAIIFSWVFSIFYRLVGHLSPILSLPMLMVTLEEASKGSSRRSYQLSFRGSVMLFGMLIMLVSFARGSMSSLKFFVL